MKSELKEQLGHPDHRVRIVAMVSSWSDLAGRDFVVLMSSDPHPAVRRALARLLGDWAVSTDKGRRLLQSELSSTPESPADERGALVLLSAVGRALTRVAAADAEAFGPHVEQLMRLGRSPRADVVYQVLSALRAGLRRALFVVAVAELRVVVGDALSHEDREVALLAAECTALAISPDGVGCLDGDDEVRGWLVALWQRARARRWPLAPVGLSLMVGRVEEELEDVVGELSRLATRLPEGLDICRSFAEAGRVEELERVAGRLFVHRLIRVAALVGRYAARPGPDAASGVRRALKHRRRDARGYAMELVGDYELDAFADELLAVARSADDYHADTAAIALGQLGRRDVLRELVGSGREDVRAAAAATLVVGKAGAVDVDVLRLLDDDPSPQVRQAIADALLENP